MRFNCSGVQWSACSWVMTTATVPADSVIGRRERSRVDVEPVAVLLEDEGGVFQLGQSHDSSQHPGGASVQHAPPVIRPEASRPPIIAV